MKLMGLDLSLSSTGISMNSVTSVIRSKAKGAERLSEVTKSILHECLENEIDCVVIEGYSFASRSGQAFSIGELGGCIRMTLFECNIPIIEVPPTCRAKFATGRGNASKGEVISAISAKTGIIFSGASGNDECDAWVLEQMALTYLGKSQYVWTKEQLSALDKIDWSQMDGAINA
jgi:Holliday junction resolvasome RuvABC endonuclease subunit